MCMRKTWTYIFGRLVFKGYLVDMDLELGDFKNIYMGLRC